MSDNEKLKREERYIAYFSMEIGIHPDIPTYSGGLGILAGDTIKSCADLKVPMVAVTLLYRKGYFYQKLNRDGDQEELPYRWEPKECLTPLEGKISLRLNNRNVSIQAWKYLYKGNRGYYIPVIFLDSDIDGNHEDDRMLTHTLYGGDDAYRLSQEAILGIGGVRMLDFRGYKNIRKYHMNEGHSSLLALELLNKSIGDRDLQSEEDFKAHINKVQSSCIFTTHTPVPAGHDQFSYELVGKILNPGISHKLLKKIGGHDKLNMTLLAMNLSHYVNGVAKEHGKISRGMFPNYPVDSITNGVHSATWVSDSFKKLYDRYIPGWAEDPFSFRYAISIPRAEIWDSHMVEKINLINHINSTTENRLSASTLTVGFARRSTSYKRPDLVFRDIGRLLNIAKANGKIQFIFSGKAHPKDDQGKKLIKKIIQASQELGDAVKIVYLKNYDIALAKKIISGVDLWLNTPQKPNEASGTSGMKAAHNGVPSFSILDGWWIEGCIEDVTGWSIGSNSHTESSDLKDASLLYSKLEDTILPKFYNDRESWIEIMRYAISINASFFNTHRMVQQYVVNAYAY
ncbi:MAG: alpha-glucan family phosphorylase [Actinomycetota bacterium]